MAGAKRLRKSHVGFYIAVLLSSLFLFSFGSSTSGVSPVWASAPVSLKSVSFTLDNVTLEVTTPFLPSRSRGIAEPGNASQVASFTNWHPFEEFSVTAIPFGTRGGTESGPVARSGGAPAYLQSLREFRARQGGTLHSGPTARLFSQALSSLASVVDLPLYVSGTTPALVVEWVAEAGNRLWIVRVTQELQAGSGGKQGLDPENAFLASLSGLRVESSDPDRPSTISLSSVGKQANAARIPTPGNPNDLPFPAWWNGSDCDYDHYTSASGGTGSYRLGASFMGMAACGPRPIGDNGPDVLVHFFPGSWGEYDFECVELAMRFLYLAYGINPYQANGNQVVPHYNPSYGGNLQAVNNGTVGIAPQPGDVLSYGAASQFGHASVVTESSVDSSGNGVITVIEENNAFSGESYLSVQGWYVGGNAGSVIGWLTPGGGAVPTSTPTEPPVPTPTATPDPGCWGERFHDVCPGDYYYDAVLYLNDRGAISGYADGTFRPFNGATRGQLAKMIVLAEGWAIDTTGGPHFWDVPTGNPFYLYVETAYNRGAIGGYTDGTFRWGANVTRGQLCKIIVLAQSWPIYSSGFQRFIDVPTDDPFYPYIETAFSHAIISGYADNTFRPRSSATRGQISKIVYNALTGTR